MEVGEGDLRAGDVRLPSDQETSVFGRLVGLMNGVGTLWIFVLMVLINADIIGRGALNHPVQGVNEIVSMSIVGLVFLQLAHTLRSGRFLQSDLFLGNIQRRAPKLGLAIEAFYNFVGAMMMGIILYFGIPHFIETWNVGEYVGTYGQFTFPLWPIRLVMLFAVVITAIQFLILMVASLQQMAGSTSARASVDL